MDQVSILYREEYNTAKAYSDAGESGKCLDILFKMRLYPDLSLYRKALVNLLIATTADLRTHPDLAKYAQECIDLIAQVRRDDLHEGDKDSEAEMSRIEEHAQKTLQAIENMSRKMQDKEQVLKEDETSAAGRAGSG